MYVILQKYDTSSMYMYININILCKVKNSKCMFYCGHNNFLIFILINFKSIAKQVLTYLYRYSQHLTPNGNQYSVLLLFSISVFF